MKKLFISLFVFFTSIGYAQKVDSNFHVYLLVGQSNMAGRGKLDDVSQQSNTQIFMLDSSNNWVQAKDPVHFDKPKAVGVGPAISFANEMLQANSSIKIGLIPCAWGGSPIKVWQPGAKYFNNYPYDEAIARTKVAMQTGVLKGILWHQGESDNDSIKSKVYIEKLKILINRFRADLQSPQLPFVLGEIGYFNKQNFINSLLPQIIHQVKNTALVLANGLQHKGDVLHFDAASARVLGKRYATAMQKLQSQPLLPISLPIKQ